MKSVVRTLSDERRRHFIGGFDARVIMGQDEKAVIRLWQEKRGEVGPEDLSSNLIVQLGLATEDLNRQWYERKTGNAVLGQAPGPPLDGGRWRRGGDWGYALPIFTPSCAYETELRRHRRSHQ
jgi:hypothetical protein